MEFNTNFIKRFYYDARTVFYRLNNYLIYKNRTSKSYTVNQQKPSAIINLDKVLLTNDSGRYCYILCVYLSYCGFNVIIKTNWNFFESLKFYQKLLLKQKYLLVRKCSTPINTVLLNGPKYRNKLVNINYGYKSLTSENYDCIAPYPMHPSHNKHLPVSKNLTEEINIKRTIKIFFSGNTDKTLYNKEVLKKEFDILSRYEVISFIKTAFKTTNQMQVVKDATALGRLMNSDLYNNQIVITEIKTAEADWIKMLKKASFFICTPGVNSPWCHNAIEAMSAATIPVLQYAHLFHPSLENKKNCLIYNNYDELHEVMELALAMSATEIETMQKNVIDYYNKHLSVESIAKRIKKFTDSDYAETTVAIPFIKSNEDVSSTHLSTIVEKAVLVR